jgi:hypothetical protein
MRRPQPKISIYPIYGARISLFKQTELAHG